MEPETTILEEDIDEDYEPTQEGTPHIEIEEYADYIGLDLDEDQDLLYIAREGLKAPLPPPWKPCQVKGKEIFYFNFETQESVWEHPCDKFYKEKAKELKTAKAKRRSSDSKPARTPPSAGKPASSGFSSKPPDLPSKVSKPDKLSSELEAFRMELEADKQMVQERNSMQLEEFKKDLKNQLSDEEQRLKKSFETDKELKWTEARKAIASQVEKDMESTRLTMRQRLDSIRDSLSRELSQARKKAEDDERRSLQSFVESETLKAQDEMRTQSRDIDSRLERLQRELDSLREAELTAGETDRHALAQSEAALRGEISRVQSAKDSLLKSETAKEQNRLDNEISAIRAAADLRIRDFQRNMSSASTTDDLSAKEARLRDEAERTLQSEAQTVKARNQERLQEIKHDCDLKLEEDRLRQMQDQTRGSLSRFEEERKLIDLDARQTLAAYHRSLTQQLEAEKRRMTDEMRMKIDSLKGQNSDYGQTGSEELEIDGQVRMLAQELSQWQDIARKKNGQLEQMRATHETAVREAARMQDDVRGRRQRPSTADSHDRVARMEREVFELKRLVLDSPEPARPSTAAKPVHDPVHQWRMALQQEKVEIKEFQKVIEQEKRAWMNDCTNYRDRPTAERKTELQAVKRVLDQQIMKLNDRVKELKLAENWIKKQEGGELLSLDDELEEMKPDPLSLEPEDEVLARWRHPTPDPSPPYNPYPAAPLQPMATHKMQVYQRFLTREASKNDQIQSLFTRQNMWISNMKEEVSDRQLSKVHFSPSTRVPRTSYYY